MKPKVETAVILAAGNGDRFKATRGQSKLLHPLLGQPLILRAVDVVAAAGISALTLVIGYDADNVRAVVQRHAPTGLDLTFVYNPDWHLENGVSALKARERCDGSRFALLMGDHLVDPDIVSVLVREAGPNDSLLAVDRGVPAPDILAEATRVQMRGDRILAIGKGLEPWDAVDTGVFVFTPAIFEALEQAAADGDTTLSGGVQRLAARGMMRGVDIGRARWCDIDTSADLKAAEMLLSYGPRESEPA
jgi:1L-myo-inositol 1-phosphate cytidylyltransferase